MKTFDETTSRKVKTLFQPTPSGISIDKYVDASGRIQLRVMGPDINGTIMEALHLRTEFKDQAVLDEFINAACGVLRFDTHRATAVLANAIMDRTTEPDPLKPMTAHAYRAWLGAIVILSAMAAAVLSGVTYGQHL